MTTLRIDGDDIWCLQMLLANNIDLPQPIAATASISGTQRNRVTYNLIVETGREVEVWADAMTDLAHNPTTATRIGDEMSADGWMECPNHGPGVMRGHTIKVAVTSRLRAFTTTGSAA